ncbi:guanylate-binding protein 1-like isoform X1 [Hypomesus transpacificus]|uniref:guanylate-binding protein 1-like isoform X1 n=2 Tax=Hypomesus transpacificus TaxID=137520 RepID=UPI001F085EDF|nr:guanylate-binding protein 1-like isoform X1 [Hypomesus transpacificus]XP_046902451.1 guanylate-binding protein 1-like isoform X1 [Hypomesus transpacificus]XP_046902452.1 guanylate-binding protein 1-like isoform X1 [Hypomesus transpacificus]XP_046902453.1 guanylate-binding protein 1-like isoform X1 [Hypomesus transpacificus]
MSGTVSMKEPVCLVESDKEGRLRVVPAAQDILNQIDQHVVAVAVVGLYRTGKSYLMNKLAGKNKGFALGSTIQSKTKGIWMWCVPHPKQADHTLVLLDTEGLGDVEKGDEKNDNWIFSLAVLLSSTLVYNSMGTIDNNALEKLHYVTELTEHIKVKSGQTEDDDAEYMQFFPSFVWTVRDFTLELKLEGQAITADQYLENALKLKPGTSPKTQAYNLPRSCLRNYFSPRWCFVFERPANGEKMRRMEDLTDADLEPDFVQQSKDFCTHVFTNAKTKTLKGGLLVTGRLLGNLAETYVAAIRSGQIPCLDNAVLALSEIENSCAVERARVFYQESMASWVAFPTEDLEELSDIHAQIEKEALVIFMKSTFKDEDQKYQKRLAEVLEAEYRQIHEKNCQESKRVCESIIKRVFGPLEEEGSSVYTVPGGYYNYCTDLQMMTKLYKRTEGKGVKAEEVLQVYLDGLASLGQTILAADNSLSEAEQRTKEEEARREQAERQQCAAEEQVRFQKRLQEDQDRTHQQHVDQLMEKIEVDRRNAAAEYDRVLQVKLTEQRSLLQQGFDDRASRLQGQINQIQEDRRRAEQKRSSGGCILQ